MRCITRRGDGRPAGHAWTVIGIHAVFMAGVGLSTTFVNVFLWRHGGGLATVVRYHVALFLGFALGGIVAGGVALRRDRVVALRWGVALQAAFFLAVLLLGGRAAAFIWPLGTLTGLAMGFYYLGCSALVFDFSQPASAHRLVGAVDQARLAGATIAPFLAGWLVDRSAAGRGYPIVFGASVALFVLAVALSRRIPPSGRPARAARLREVFGSAEPRWRTYLVAQGWRGLRDGVFLFLIGVLVFERTGDELALGLFALGTGALTWMATAWVGRRAKPERQRGLLSLGAAGSALAAGALVLLPGWYGVALFGVLESASLPLVAVPFSALTYVIAGANPSPGPSGVGYMVTREIPLNLGRLVGVILLLGAVEWVRHPSALPAVLAALGLANLGALWALRRGGT